METRFSAMEAAADAHVGCARAVVKTVVALSLPFVLSPREIAVEAASSVAAVFTSCFSRLHARPEFNAEQQQALLSPEDEDADARMVSEAAMRELRRRVMEGSVSAAKMSRWGPVSSELRQQRHTRQSGMQERSRAQSSPVPVMPTLARADDPQAFTTLLTDTEQALERILGPVKANTADKKLLDAETARRRSADELLASGEPHADGASSPEETGGESVLLKLQDETESEATTSPVREWLAAIDAPRAEEYRGYARQLEQHGFVTLADLAQLEGDDDVEQAMSEAGIAKFAHRLRIRKAIQQLHASGSGGSVAVAASA